MHLYAVVSSLLVSSFPVAEATCSRLWEIPLASRSLLELPKAWTLCCSGGRLQKCHHHPAAAWASAVRARGPFLLGHQCKGKQQIEERKWKPPKPH